MNKYMYYIDVSKDMIIECKFQNSFFIKFDIEEINISKKHNKEWISIKIFYSDNKSILFVENEEVAQINNKYQFRLWFKNSSCENIYFKTEMNKNLPYKIFTMPSEYYLMDEYYDIYYSEYFYKKMDLLDWLY